MKIKHILMSRDQSVSRLHYLRTFYLCMGNVPMVNIDLREQYPITHFLLNQDPNCIEIKTIDGSKKVIYHNKILKGSPFTLSITFGLTFTYEQILRDKDVCKWLEQVTGLKPHITWS